jgi:hypothetical protein
MRYKEPVTTKLENLGYLLNQLDNLINQNDRNAAKQFIVTLKEKIEDIQTLINSED